jgi:hypothetical protein
VRTRGASCIRSHVLKFQAMCSLSSHLAIFHPHALSRSSITLETIRHRCHLPSSIPALEHAAALSPAPEHATALGQAVRAPLLVIVTPPPPSTLTPPPSERVATLDLNPTSLRACCCHPLHQALDTASDKGDTPPLPHYHCRLVRFERYLLPM